MRQLKKEFEEHFLHAHPRVKQFAVGVEQGGEVMFRMIADSLKGSATKVAVGNDAKKAYQNFDRESLWPIIDEKFPQIANLVRLCYGIPSAVLLKDAGLGDPVVLLNGCGARQGCPLGSLIYSLVQHPILVEVAEKYEDLEVYAFVDDATFISNMITLDDVAPVGADDLAADKPAETEAEPQDETQPDAMVVGEANEPDPMEGQSTCTGAQADEVGPRYTCSACEANSMYSYLYTLRLRGKMNEAKSLAFSFMSLFHFMSKS